jgi:hypothetical protein
MAGANSNPRTMKYQIVGVQIIDITNNFQKGFQELLTALGLLRATAGKPSLNSERRTPNFPAGDQQKAGTVESSEVYEEFFERIFGSDSSLSFEQSHAKAPNTQLSKQKGSSIDTKIMSKTQTVADGQQFDSQPKRIWVMAQFIFWLVVVVGAIAVIVVIIVFSLMS